MKKIWTILFLITFFTGYAQNKKAVKYFKLGVEAFNNSDFTKADSLFLLSLKKEAHPDTYYNLAVTKQKLGDHCGFCDNLKKAIYYGDGNSSVLYYNNCIQFDTILYTNHSDSNVFYYCIYSIEKCINKNSYYFFMKKIREDSIYCFLVKPINSNKYKEEDFKNQNFNIEMIPSINKSYYPYNCLPSFPGGNLKLFTYLFVNTKYPYEAYKYSISGAVNLTFFVEPDGCITDIKVINGIGKGCDEEAVRVVKSMPHWNPGIINGVFSRTAVNLSISFIIPRKFIK